MSEAFTLFLTNAALKADKNNIQRKKVGRVVCDCASALLRKWACTGSEMCNLQPLCACAAALGGLLFIELFSFF